MVYFAASYSRLGRAFPAVVLRSYLVILLLVL